MSDINEMTSNGKPAKSGLGPDAEQRSFHYIVIGAGVAGLSCASRLMDNGKSLLVIEKARGSGGRLSSKRIATSTVEPLGFDLGCSSFTAKHDDFRQQLSAWSESGRVASFAAGPANDDPRWVGVPRNSSITRGMVNDVEGKGGQLEFACRVSRARYHENRWELEVQKQGETTAYYCAELIIATPAEQASQLLSGHLSSLGFLQNVSVAPQWVVMLALEQQAFDAGQGPEEALVENAEKHTQEAVEQGFPPDSCIEQLSFEYLKPGRSALRGVELVQVQLRAEWSSEHLNMTENDVLSVTLGELQTMIGTRKLLRSHVHRWLYSYTAIPAGVGDAFWQSDVKLGLCGDYFVAQNKESGVESAFLSGSALARKLVKEKEFSSSPC